MQIRDKISFNVNEKHRVVLKQLFGEDVLDQLDVIEHDTFVKTSKNKMLAKREKKHVKLEHKWKKKRIMFQLPHWRTLIIRHNLNVMHIEKNICNSIVGASLSIGGK